MQYEFYIFPTELLPLRAPLTLLDNRHILVIVCNQQKEANILENEIRMVNCEMKKKFERRNEVTQFNRWYFSSKSKESQHLR